MLSLLEFSGPLTLELPSASLVCGALNVRELIGAPTGYACLTLTRSLVTSRCLSTPSSPAAYKPCLWRAIHDTEPSVIDIAISPEDSAENTQNLDWIIPLNKNKMMNKKHWNYKKASYLAYAIGPPINQVANWIVCKICTYLTYQPLQVVLCLMV